MHIYAHFIEDIAFLYLSCIDTQSGPFPLCLLSHSLNQVQLLFLLLFLARMELSKAFIELKDVLLM